MTKIIPTQQQKDIIRAAKKGKSFKVAALAASGKTSLVKMIAKRLPEKAILYLAFNRLIVEHAKETMPPNVMARTLHSMAFGQVGYAYKHRLVGSVFAMKKQVEILVGNEIQAICSLSEMNEVQSFVAIMETFTNFLNGVDKECKGAHIPDWATDMSPRGIFEKKYKNTIKMAVNKLWSEMSDRSSPMPVLHDVYLKVWAMKVKRLPYDIIMSDESQDLNDLTIHIFLSQKHMQKIAVGDSNQQLYRFRGSVNAMEKLDLPSFPLTQSWRFGKNIADYANNVLSLSTDLRLEGMREKDALEFGDNRDTVCALSRSNGALVLESINYLDEGKRIHIVGGTRDAVAYLRSAYDLFQGKRTTHAELSQFRSWAELVEASQSHAGNVYRPIVKLVSERGSGILHLARRLEGEVYDDPDNADVTLSTTHKFKGMERQSVRLLDDFGDLIKSDEKGVVLLNKDECNVVYVALTRAKERLVVGPEMALNIKTATEWKKTEGDKNGGESEGDK